MLNQFAKQFNLDPQLGPALYNAIGDGDIDEVRRILESPQRPRLEDIRDPEDHCNVNILTHVFEPWDERRSLPEVQTAIMKLLLIA